MSAEGRVVSEAVGHIEERLLRALARVGQAQSSEAFVRAILNKRGFS